VSTCSPFLGIKELKMTAGMEKMVADHPCYLKKLKEKIDMKKIKNIYKLLHLLWG